MENRTKSFIITLLFFCISRTYAGQIPALNSRLIILADMGNEPDEEQQIVHMIMCSNEFELEGLIAVTGKYLRPESGNPYKQKLHPELFINIINGYAKVLDNLKKHASGWHDPGYLKSIVTTGQKGYGIADVGDGKTSPGSELITRAVMRDDPRPVWLVVNAGSNTLAQALWDYRKNNSRAEVDRFVSKLRVFENGAQDNAGAWICANFQKIHWIRSNYQTYCYGGPGGDGGADNRGRSNNLGPYTWKPYAYSGLGQHQWALEQIKGNHGPLGKLWPIRQFDGGNISFLEGGGTIPWLGLVNKGLFDIEHPHWGGWSGRFSREKVENYWSRHSDIKIDEKKSAPFYVYKEEADEWIDPETGKNITIFSRRSGAGEGLFIMILYVEWIGVRIPIKRRITIRSQHLPGTKEIPSYASGLRLVRWLRLMHRPQWTPMVMSWKFSGGAIKRRVPIQKISILAIPGKPELLLRYRKMQAASKFTLSLRLRIKVQLHTFMTIGGLLLTSQDKYAV